MSERGSICTNYIYCEETFKALTHFFKSHPNRGKYLNVNPVENGYPILAGKIGGMYSGEELVYFYEISIEIIEIIKFPVAFTVMSDCGGIECFLLKPGEMSPDVKRICDGDWDE